MPVGSEQFPSLLRNEALTAETHRFMPELIAGKFPILGLFPRETYTSDTITVPVYKYIRSLAAIHAAEAPGDVAERDLVGRLTVSPFFMQEKISVPSGHLLSMVMNDKDAPDENIFARDRHKSAMKWLSKWLRGSTTAQLRALHKVCCDILSQSGINPGDGTFPTVSIDGVSVDLNYGIPEVTDAGVDWSSASADILADLVDIIDAAELDHDDEITDIIVSKSMVSDYIYKNEKLREFLIRDPQLRGDVRRMMQTLSDAERPGLTWHIVNDVYTAADGTGRTQVWPKDRMTLISNTTVSNPEGVFELASVRTQQNEYTGQRATYAYTSEDAKGTTLVNSDNGIPLVRDGEKVTVKELTPQG